MEVIISDDLSSDKTAEIINSFRGDPRIKILENRERLGVVKNFERAFKTCSSKYIAFADQDDVWLPSKLENSILALQTEERKSGSVPMLVFSDLKVVNAGLKILHESYLQANNLNPNNTRLSNILVENVITGCTMVINRELASILQPFPAQVKMHDMYVGLVAAAFGKIIYLNETTVLYRQHGANVLGHSRNSVRKSLQNTLSGLTGSAGKDYFLDAEIAQAQAFLDQYGHILKRSKR